MKRLAMDINVAGHTVDNIRDAFQTLLRTSYHFQVMLDGSSQEDQEEVKLFLKHSMEVFTDWGTMMNKMGEYF